MALKQLSERCKNCEYKDNCDEKRMAECDFLEHKPIMQPLIKPLIQPLQEEILVKHDYRDIKVGENTTVTIDLEEMKKKIEKDFYKSLNCGFLQDGA